MLKKALIGMAVFSLLAGSLGAFPRMVLFEEFTGQS